MSRPGPNAAAISTLWILAIALAGMGLLIHEPRHRIEAASVASGEGRRVRTLVYLPEPPSPHAIPGVVICQPVNNPPEFSRLLALELLQEGMAVLTFDWKGRTPAECRQWVSSATPEVLLKDVQAAIEHLRGLPAVDPARVAVVGHSVGGSLALEAALADSRIAAVGVIGMVGDMTDRRPRNALWVVGLYDELRRLRPTRAQFQECLGQAVPDGETVGDFAQGTARRLGVSPTADHFTEMQDRGVHAEVRAWLSRAFSLPDARDPLRMEARALLLLSAWLSALAAALATARALSAVWLPARRVLIASAITTIAALGLVRGPSYGLACDAILGLVAFGLLAGIACRVDEAALRRRVAGALKLAALLWASVLLTLVANNVAPLFERPERILAVPETALRQPLDSLYAYLLLTPRPVLLSANGTDGAAPRPWLYLLLALELVAPGALAHQLSRLKRGIKAPGPRHNSRASLAVLALLLAILGGLGWVRFRQGFLTAESAQAAVDTIGRFAVLPLLLFVLLRRLSSRSAPPG